jgi:hypothetical protein
VEAGFGCLLVHLQHCLPVNGAFVAQNTLTVLGWLIGQERGAIEKLSERFSRLQTLNDAGSTALANLQRRRRLIPFYN